MEAVLLNYIILVYFHARMCLNKQFYLVNVCIFRPQDISSDVFLRKIKHIEQFWRRDSFHEFEDFLYFDTIFVSILVHRRGRKGRQPESPWHLLCFYYYSIQTKTVKNWQQFNLIGNYDSVFPFPNAFVLPNISPYAVFQHWNWESASLSPGNSWKKTERYQVSTFPSGFYPPTKT